MNCQERAEASQTLMPPPRHSVLKSMLLQSECTRTYKNSIKLHEAIARNAVPILFSTNCQPSPITTNRQHQYRPPAASHQPPPNCHPPLSLQPSRLPPTPGVVQPLSLYCGKVFPPLECVLDLGLFISARTSAPRHARHHAHAHAHAGPPPVSQTASSLPPCP